MNRIFILLFALLLTSEVKAQIKQPCSTCLPEGIEFWDQDQVDNFQVNHPNCTVIEGSVKISSYHGITNLNGLSLITQIGGGLIIENNLHLSNLAGLENLTSIGGELKIYYNEGLTSLTGLENLTVIGGDLTLIYNELLTGLIPLGNIESGSIDNIIIYENQSLSNCNAQSICDYLLNPTGYVVFFKNADGCNNPHEIASNCDTIIPCLPHGHYYLTTQAEIDSFQTFYPGCTDLHGWISITGDDITNLDGLNVITSVEGGIEIKENFNLTSISGLGNITFIGQDLFVRGNYALTSLSGLDNIDADSIEGLSIYGNTSLSRCEVQSICEYLGNPNGYLSILHNAPGCNSQEEVEAACEVGIGESAVVSRQSLVNIYPNPATDLIFIELTGNTFQFQISIFDLSGQETISGQVTEAETLIDISSLLPGVYFARVTTDRTVQVGKFVKQ